MIRSYPVVVVIVPGLPPFPSSSSSGAAPPRSSSSSSSSSSFSSSHNASTKKSLLSAPSSLSPPSTGPFLVIASAITISRVAEIGSTSTDIPPPRETTTSCLADRRSSASLGRRF
jgi:hypothetical protein